MKLKNLFKKKEKMHHEKAKIMTMKNHYIKSSLVKVKPDPVIVHKTVYLIQTKT